MKSPFELLDRILEHRVRLQIMSVLVANDTYDYGSLKELLGITDGNLASHLKTLESEKYIQVRKSFVDRKPHTRYKATDKGRLAFRKHLEAMAEVVRLDKA